MTVLEKINFEISEFNKKKEQLVNELKGQLPTMLLEIFNKSKLINSIGWTQYTPYFMDGDECVFDANVDDLYVNEVYQDELPWYSYRVKYDRYKDEISKNPNIDLHECSVLSEFSSILNSIPNDFLKDMFGDHCKVTIYKEGKIEVEEYDHD